MSEFVRRPLAVGNIYRFKGYKSNGFKITAMSLPGTPSDDTALPVAAVRDGDKNDSPADNIFKLPGGLAPEKELLSSVNVIGFFGEKYEFDVPSFNATMKDIDHHEWFNHLSERVSINKNALIQQCAECYVENLTANDRDTLTNLLKESLRK